MLNAALPLDTGVAGKLSSDELVARIAAILAHLEVPIAQIDASFVVVGDELLGCATLLSKVTSSFEALPEDLESAELVEATHKLGEVIRHALEIAGSFSIEQADLVALIARVDAARAPMAKLRKIIQMIGILAINARMVAATIAGEDEEFSVFTTDIAALSKHATGTIRRFFKAYEHLSSDLHKVAAERARFQAAQQSALEQAAGRLSDNLEQVTRRREHSAQNSAEVGRVTRDISARIGATVVAMQVGDSTRQRIEHVASALGDLKRMVVDDEATTYRVPEVVRAHGAATVLHIEDQLLAAARADYDGGVVDAEISLAGLTADAGAIMSQSRDLYGQKDHQGESALGALSADMRQVAVMLEACQIDRRKLDAAAMAVGEMVSQLLGHVEAVQQIEGSMRLVTLNAAIRCAQLGPRGKALNVIAKQLRELTGDTVVSAKAALTVLNQAAERAQNVTDSADGEGSDRIIRLLDEATAAIGLFEQVDRRLSAALQLLDEQGVLANSKLEEAERLFAGHAAISESLADAHLEVVGLMTDVGGPDVEAIMDEELGIALLERLRKNYTMACERHIHDKITGVIPVAPASEDGGPSESEDDDLGLF